LIDADVADAQAMLGHHSPAVTLQFYKKAIPPRQQEAVDKLESKLKVVPISRGQLDRFLHNCSLGSGKRQRFRGFPITEPVR
jgi:hypothetical protein